ncbi:MAG: hypothetical protein HQK53_02330 [Oligoflexia bacterium]|nr:hypothetical protein [Oligoflexia bacterium]
MKKFMFKVVIVVSTVFISFIAITAFTAFTAFCHFTGWAPEGTIGSQDNGAPGFVYRPPINKTNKITGPIPSNNWWAGVLVKDDVITMSPYPLIVYPCKDRYPAENGFFGLGISYKGNGYVMSASGGPIIGYSKKNWKIGSYVHYDLLLMNDKLEQISTKTKVDGYGDWHVNLQTADNNGHQMNSTITAGSPYIFTSFQNGNPRIRLNSFAGNIHFYDKQGNAVLINSDYVTSDHIVVKLLQPITQEVRWYGLYADEGTTWKREGSNLSVSFASNNHPSNYLTVALIPSLADAPLFYEHAYTKIVGTYANYRYNESEAAITTTFNITTVPLRKSMNTEPLITLFPHQYKNLATPYSQEKHYQTMRGKLKIFIGHTFETVLKNHGILHSFNEPLKSLGYDHGLALEYLYKEQEIKNNYNVDTYGGGKALLRIAESINIADKLGPAASELKNEFIESLYNEFADWFTYSPGKEKTFWADGGPHHFMTYFSPEGGYWGNITGWRAGFGTQALNDMHFHYGYWIHAAAILVQYHPTFLQDYGSAIDELVRNIASPYRDDRQFPHLRYFSPYTGRSYANGWCWDDNYSGNDQESSSEAMNAWAAIYLWGLVTGNNDYRDLGLYLYWTEKSAIDQYWLDVDREILHPDYPYSHAVILRETAYEFETFWGSKYIEELYGIQMLPMTAATLYLGLNQSYANMLWKEMWGIHQKIYGKDAEINAWDGIMLRFLSLIDPQLAISKYQFGKIHGPQGAPEPGILDQETWTSTYFFIHNLNQLGSVVADIYADKPSFGVFKKNNIYTFVGYNPSTNKSLTINFKDTSGKVIHSILNIPPKTTMYDEVFRAD